MVLPSWKLGGLTVRSALGMVFASGTEDITTGNLPHPPYTGLDIFVKSCKYDAMWPFQRKPDAQVALQLPTKPSEHLSTWLRETAERLALVEGDIAGLKVSLESIAESLHKQTAKWNARARAEAAEAREDNGRQVDPRLAALARARRR